MSEDIEYFKSEISHTIDEVLKDYTEKNIITNVEIIYIESIYTFAVRFSYTFPCLNFNHMILAPDKVYARLDPLIEKLHVEFTEKAWNTVKEILQKLEKETVLCRLALGRS